MELRLKYNEINNAIAQKAGRELPLSYGGPHTVRANCSVNMLFKQVNMDIDITVDRIEGSDIYLSYSGGAGIEFMVKQAIGMVKKRPGGELIEPLEGNRLLLALGKNAQVGSIFEKVELRDIRFDEYYAIAEFSPKASILA